MKNILLITLLLVLATTAYAAKSKPKPKSCNINCLIADPVCTVDGNEYGCGRPEACCHNEKIACKGTCPCGDHPNECKVKCKVGNPVCGKSGATYTCAGEAKCHNDPVVSEGECPPCSEPMPAYIDDPEQSKDNSITCANVRCKSGTQCKETLEGPRCQPDPCSTVKCSDGHMCVVNDGKARCEAILSCSLLDCGEGQSCQPVSGCKDHASVCPKTCKSCLCSTLYKPVCGADGSTYSNECTARCNGVEVAHQGRCRDSCICPLYYKPVCGPDGKVYSNPCFAQCAGALGAVPCGTESI